MFKPVSYTHLDVYKRQKQGAVVVVCARRINLIGKVREQCAVLSGREAFSYQLDIADPESVERVVEALSLIHI